MPKRPLAVLAPTVVVVALAALPAVSQAAPHYYRNGVLIPEGQQVPILEWGNVRFQPGPNELLTPDYCDVVAGGYVENPFAGGAGVGATEAFATYDCEDPECPPGAVEIKGKQYEKVFQIAPPPQTLPWPTLLQEPEAGKIRTRMSNVAFQVDCYGKPLTRAEAERETTSGAGENELFPLVSAATCVTAPEHELTPLDENGTSASSPSKLVFDVKSGTLSCSSATVRIEKKLKLIGYNGSELISVKSP